MGGPSYSKHLNQRFKKETTLTWPELMSPPAASARTEIHVHFCVCLLAFCHTEVVHFEHFILGFECESTLEQGRGPPDRPQRDWVRGGMQRNIVKASNKRTKVRMCPGLRGWVCVRRFPSGALALTHLYMTANCVKEKPEISLWMRRGRVLSEALRRVLPFYCSDLWRSLPSISSEIAELQTSFTTMNKNES